MIRFYKKSFSDDSQLVEFTKSINPNFTNSYSFNYRQINKVWQTTTLDEEVDEIEYQHLINKSALLEQFEHLFNQYQNDLNHNNIAEILQYFPDFRETEKYKNYQYHLIKNSSNIIYQPKIIDIALIDFRQLLDKSIFRIQINAEMINFIISERGYILEGDSQPKMFSEYWDIELDSEGKCRIKEISIPWEIKIAQLDLEAKLTIRSEGFVS